MNGNIGRRYIDSFELKAESMMNVHAVTETDSLRMLLSRKQSFILTWAGWRWEQCALASAGDDDHTSEGSGEVPEAAEHALE